MADITWMAYAGVVTGVMGCITGVVGSVMGFVAYRRTGKLKALDLRLELRTAADELRRTIAGLSALLEDAKNSRTRVLAATGMMRSGASELAERGWQADLAEIGSLQADVPLPEAGYSKASHDVLERNLVVVSDLRNRAERLQGKLQASLAADDVSRQGIRADDRRGRQK